MPDDTPVDRLSTDQRLSQAMDDVVARARAHRPVRVHRLIHVTLQCQMGVSFDLADLTDLKWRLARGGIETVIQSEWLSLKDT